MPQRKNSTVELVAFTADHVARLTGLSKRQLRYWDQTGFFNPTLIDDVGERVFGRIYSFRDLVGLRTISILRDRVPLQELRRIGEWLHREHRTPWASLRFGLLGRTVVFTDPKSGANVIPRGRGQTVHEVALEPIADDMRGESAKLRDREKGQLGQIRRNRFVVHNAWVVAGTRIPTGAIWNFHMAGYSTEDIIREYPRLTPKDVRAAVAFEHRRKRAA